MGTERVLSPGKVAEMLGVARSSLFRIRRDPEAEFPAPIRISTRRIGWVSGEVQEWINSRPRAGSGKK